jgi:hypothetical protein
VPADGVVTAKFHGGAMRGAPTFVVIHDAETPLADSYVQSIAGYFQRGPAAGTSAHHMIGPRTWLQLLPENVVAYAAGAKANPRGIHVEQTGYARFSRAEWTTADGLAQLERVAGCVREACDRWSIPKRWATAAQLQAAAAGQPGAGGIVYHDHVSKWLGGTSHHDPTPGYPGDLLLAAVLGGGTDDMAGLGNVNMEQLRDLLHDALWPEPRDRSPYRRRGEILLILRDTFEAVKGLPAFMGQRANGTGDRLTDIWNRDGETLAAVKECRGLLQRIVTKLDA